MLTSQIKVIFDSLIKEEIGTEAQFFFSSENQRESARIRFINQKNLFEKATRKSAPIAISRITNGSTFGVKLLRISDNTVFGFIRRPGETSFSNLTIPEEIVFPDIDPALLNTEMLPTGESRADIIKLLKAEGMDDEAIEKYFGTDIPADTSDLPDFSLTDDEDD
jgi:hypothetical protein